MNIESSAKKKRREKSGAEQKGLVKGGPKNLLSQNDSREFDIFPQTLQPAD